MSSNREMTSLLPSHYFTVSGATCWRGTSRQVCLHSWEEPVCIYFLRGCKAWPSTSILLPLFMDYCSLFAISGSQVPQADFQAWLPRASNNHPTD